MDELQEAENALAFLSPLQGLPALFRRAREVDAIIKESQPLVDKLMAQVHTWKQAVGQAKAEYTLAADELDAKLAADVKRLDESYAASLHVLQATWDKQVEENAAEYTVLHDKRQRLLEDISSLERRRADVVGDVAMYEGRVAKARLDLLRIREEIA